MKKSQLPAFDINKVNIGTRVVTRDGHSGRIDSINLEKLDYPVSAIIELDGKETPLIFTKEGRFYSDDRDSMFDLFLEEEKIEDQKSIQSEKQDKDEINRPQSKDNIPNAAIVFEEFNGGEGFYRIQIDYLSKKQVEELEEIIKDWNKQEKQKPIDNDAPKFKVGDWVVTNDDEVHQVKEITNYGYTGILDNNRYLSSSWTDMYHLWTIKDTKVGDILINGSNIFIIHYLHDKYIVSSCHVNINDGKFYNDSDKHFCIGSTDEVVTLATKEQCNFLVQKMKEAGYKWDKENKELKKINKEDKELKQINKEVKTRLMTHQELSDWLCQCSEEHREMKYKKCATIYKYHSYYENEANISVDDILIRKNHGEWKEPLIEM